MWFRRDLRLLDNTALYHALNNGENVFCVFVFDTTILNELTDVTDQRVDFIWRSVIQLKQKIRNMGGELQVVKGNPIEEIPKIVLEFEINAVYFGEDYEPCAIERDKRIKQTLSKYKTHVRAFKDQVILGKSEVLSPKGSPYTVFTPYKKAWKQKMGDISSFTELKLNIRHFAQCKVTEMIKLRELGFTPPADSKPHVEAGEIGAQRCLSSFEARIQDYHHQRDFPHLSATSRLSVHLRFGTISIRQVYNSANQSVSTGHAAWLNELVWRDFYFSILFHFPHVANQSFKRKYDALKFTNNQAFFEAWINGNTGYPIVDAGMRQLNHTGFMHNRLRMITASFLVKDLCVDWRWGEKYFAKKLLDFDLAANNGGWQWAASTGCDAQPFFRIFNPLLQSKKFDENGVFIREFVPELRKIPDRFIHSPFLMTLEDQENYSFKLGIDYPYPIVNHAEMREQTLKMYKMASTQ